MIDVKEVINIRKMRDRDLSKYCDKCEYTGRFYSVDKDNQLSHKYCECYENDINRSRYEILLTRSGIPKFAYNFKFDAYINTGVDELEKAKNIENLNALINICRNIKNNVQLGQNYFIQGPKGTGKSLLACQIGRNAIANGLTTAYADFPVFAELFLRQLSEAESNWVDYVGSCKLLILDGIDNFKLQSGYHESIFDRIIRTRMQNNQSCCFISTQPYKNISERIGFNNASLISYNCNVLTFIGKDLRKENINGNAK